MYKLKNKQLIHLKKGKHHDGGGLSYHWPPWYTEDDTTQQKLSFQVQRFVYQSEVRDNIFRGGSKKIKHR